MRQNGIGKAYINLYRGERNNFARALPKLDWQLGRNDYFGYATWRSGGFSMLFILEEKFTRYTS